MLQFDRFKTAFKKLDIEHQRSRSWIQSTSLVNRDRGLRSQKLYPKLLSAGVSFEAKSCVLRIQAYLITHIAHHIKSHRTCTPLLSTPPSRTRAIPEPRSMEHSIIVPCLWHETLIDMPMRLNPTFNLVRHNRKVVRYHLWCRAGRHPDTACSKEYIDTPLRQGWDSPFLFNDCVKVRWICLRYFECGCTS